MYKRLLHSVLAVSFSAGLLFAVAGGSDLVWDSAPTGAAVTHTEAGSVLPPDLVWDFVPAAKDA
jgi:hypothetical protein